MFADRTKTIMVTALMLLMTGCLADDPASFRAADALLSGHWVQVGPPPAPPTVDFRVDLSFSSTSSGVPGVLVADYTGSYWQAGDVLGFRGTGRAEGVHVQFVLFRIEASPELKLTLIEITDAFVTETVSIEDVDSLDDNNVQSALRRLEGLTIPESGLGFSWDYFK